MNENPYRSPTTARTAEVKTRWRMLSNVSAIGGWLFVSSATVLTYQIRQLGHLVAVQHTAMLAVAGYAAFVVMVFAFERFHSKPKEPTQ